MTAPFVHLHNHSQYSLLDGACTLDKLLRRAAEMKMPAIALTDHGNMFGAVHFYEKARKAGIKPIVGIEAYVAEGSHTDRSKKTAYHLVLLAKSLTGYRNLMKLTTRSFLDGFYYKPRIDLDLLAKHAEGLVGLSACLQGQVSQALLRDDVSKAEALAGRFAEVLGPGSFFVELQDHGIDAERRIQRPLLELARRLDLPVVATNDCHYLEKGHAAAHDCLLALQTGKTLANENRLKQTTEELYIKTPEEMIELFREVPEAIGNTLRIAEMCALELDMKSLHLPVFQLPEGFADEDAYLRHICHEGLSTRYPEVNDAISQRLDYELGIIQRMGYAGYFLIVQDFIQYARSAGIPVGPGRGSAAGSLVAYSSGITNIDPLAYGLLFERFLNPERVTMPDIDIDFSDRGRGKVIEYTVERYGEDCVAQIITFGSMAARAVIRDVGRVMGMTYSDVDRIAKMVPATLGITLEKALATSPDLEEAAAKDARVNELLSHAQVLEGLSRHASTHAAGVVITPGALEEYVPLYKTSKDEITTQYDMKAVEKIGLLKIDLLGLRTLTVIEDAVTMIAENRGETIDIDRVDLTDPKVYELLGRGDTVGIFQFESGGMREYLRKLKPDRFDDLIAMNALFRPGPLGSGMVEDYIERRHGRQEIRYPHPDLAPILEPTYGVIVYQEQVMQIASTLAGYTLGGADLLRRAMGKKIPEEMTKQRATFVEGARARGVALATAERIFALVEHFAGYGFNKSHSAGYAFVAFQTAFLKTYYPVEFMAATMSSEMQSSDRILALMNDCRRRDIPVDPPDVNASVEGFRAVGDRIRFGLAAVKGVGRGAVQAIVAARARAGRFTDLDQLCKELDLGAVNKKALESLIAAGALDAIEGHRAQLMAAFAGAVDRAQRAKLEVARGQASLFGAPGGGNGAPRIPLPAVSEWSRDERLRLEKESLGFYVTGHPLESVERELSSLTTTTAEGLDRASDGDGVTIGGIITGVKRQFDKKGKTMARLTLEDFTGNYACLVFARTFADHAELITDESRVIISGRASAREGERASVIAEQLTPLDEAMRGLDLHLRLERGGDLAFDALRDLLMRHAGSSRVVIHVPRPAGAGGTPGEPLGAGTACEVDRPSGDPGAGRADGFSGAADLREELAAIQLTRIFVEPDPELLDTLRAKLGADRVWLAGSQRPAGMLHGG